MDEKHSTLEELREMLIGESRDNVLMVIFTLRTEFQIYRIISARKASRKEKKRIKKPKDEFDFSKARRVTPEETEAFRKAIERKLGIKLPPRGRPPKPESDKYAAVSIRLHPLIIAWAKKEAKKQGKGYQTVINEFLLKKIA